MRPRSLALLALVSALAASECPAGAAGIRAGAAKADVTPAVPTPYDLLQRATEVAHPLYARVLYLEDEDDRAVLVATDYEGLLRTAYEKLRGAISRATGVPTSRIVVNSNHSHNAPWINLDLEDLVAPTVSFNVGPAWPPPSPAEGWPRRGRKSVQSFAPSGRGVPLEGPRRLGAPGGQNGPGAAAPNASALVRLLPSARERVPQGDAERGHGAGPLGAHQPHPVDRGPGKG
jgi:hypothetical protein